MPPRGVPKQLTHFLCIPLVTSTSRPQLQASLQTFLADVKDDKTPENPLGIPEKAIRPLGTLHLTLGVMSLLTQDRVDAALNLLRSLDIGSLLSQSSTSATGGELSGNLKESKGPLKVTLRGLVSMHQPSKTSILYAPPADSDGRLQAFCSKLRNAFAEADLLVPDTRPLLLHATIVNTIYVPGVRGESGHSGRGHGKYRAKVTIDAREVLERYEGFTWMEDVRLEKVAVCRMGARRVVDAGGRETGEEEYVVEGEVEIPLVGA